MVHPLLGYVHKDLALGSCIMIVLQFWHLALTILHKNWVRSMRGELDRTRLHDLWSNPQIYLSSGLPCSTTYKISLYRSEHYRRNLLTTTNELSYMILPYLYLYISGSSAFFPNITKTLTLLTLGIFPIRVFLLLQLSLSFVHAFLHARVLLFCQLLLQFSARFLSHDCSSFLFGLMPTIPGKK
jgi:hypothetical protein